MEWLALIAQLILLGVFLLWEGYFKEKGKNLATKEDIKDITDKVESVKASYNESLERHKVELQKEFESTKYIINLCNSLDNNLITLLINCMNAISDEKKKLVYEDEGSSINSCLALCDFLDCYQTRYGNNKHCQLIMSQYGRIYGEMMNLEGNFQMNTNEYRKSVNIIYENSITILDLFLPKLDLEPIKPEH